jgi:hypothetical protein
LVLAALRDPNELRFDAAVRIDPENLVDPGSVKARFVALPDDEFLVQFDLQIS